MSRHHEDACCVCTEAISVLHFTTPIGTEEAHEACAADRSLVAKCDVCGQLAVREGITGWGEHAGDELCEHCLADRLAEVHAGRGSEVQHVA